MNPRMAAIMCLAHAVWIYYGQSIGSRPAIAWNVIAVVINVVSVAATVQFAAAESRRWPQGGRDGAPHWLTTGG